MKVLVGLVTVGISLALVACGGSDSNSSVKGVAAEQPSIQVERLKLEKEKAEAEAQAVKAEAEREAQQARASAKSAAHRAAKRAEARIEARAAEVQQKAEAEQEAEPEEVPEVVGMRLPLAKSALSAAGYTTRAENTDTTFGIIVPSHYTVCEQSEPQGHVVVVLAQKYGC